MLVCSSRFRLTQYNGVFSLAQDLSQKRIATLVWGGSHLLRQPSGSNARAALAVVMGVSWTSGVGALPADVASILVRHHRLKLLTCNAVPAADNQDRVRHQRIVHVEHECRFNSTILPSRSLRGLLVWGARSKSVTQGNLTSF